MNTRQKGEMAEKIASDYLLSKGYKFVGKNFYASKSGEIDLIFRDNEYLVFVEVKSVSESSKYNIYETLTRKKKRRIYMSINNWLLKKDQLNSIWRFDFVGIINYEDEKKAVEHFEFVSLIN